MTKVTVLMPAYNVGKYIRESIDSVLKQTYRDFELLVVDDCSTDNTAEVVKRFDDPKIKYVKNEKNLGLADNLNRGLELIETEYVARMDGDDIANPMWLEREIGLLETHPEIGICSGGFRFFGTRDGEVIYPEHPEDAQANMLFGCTVIVPVFRRSILIDNDLHYKSEAFPAEDYRLWAECIRVTKLYTIQDVLFQYRMHESQICTEKHEIQIKKADEARLHMLDWLSSDFSDDEKRYFLNQFVSGEIRSKEDFRKKKAFSGLLLEKNRMQNHFSEAALKKRFKQNITLSLYKGIVSSFFNEQYSLKQYFMYLRSGMAFRLPMKYELKFLFNSCLKRNGAH